MKNVDAAMTTHARKSKIQPILWASLPPSESDQLTFEIPMGSASFILISRIIKRLPNKSATECLSF